MSIYDPPADPYGDEKRCLHCDAPLINYGICGLHDWACPNPNCPFPFEEEKESDMEAK